MKTFHFLLLWLSLLSSQALAANGTWAESAVKAGESATAGLGIIAAAIIGAITIVIGIGFAMGRVRTDNLFNVLIGSAIVASAGIGAAYLAELAR